MAGAAVYLLSNITCLAKGSGTAMLAGRYGAVGSTECVYLMYDVVLVGRQKWESSSRSRLTWQDAMGKDSVYGRIAVSGRYAQLFW